MPWPCIYSSGLYCVPFHKRCLTGGKRGHLSLIFVAFLLSPAEKSRHITLGSAKPLPAGALFRGG